ncbi:hypothetical protein LguiA_013411 [Lonicera macranthoides]
MSLMLDIDPFLFQFWFYKWIYFNVLAFFNGSRISVILLMQFRNYKVLAGNNLMEYTSFTFFGLFDSNISCMKWIVRNWSICSLMLRNPLVNIFFVSSHTRDLSIKSKDDWIN